VLRDSVTVEMSIGARVEVVWRSLTTERHAWWPEMRFEAVVGAPLVETWIDDGHETSATGKVTHCTEPHLLGFRWIEPGWTHPLDVEMRLVPEGRSTSVTLTETGFAHAGTSPSLPIEHEEGWRYHLTRLKQASEGAAVRRDAQ
jgi:uncharacterized protein YndB with AHSA1/START domain